MAPEFPIEGRLEERGFSGSVGELDGVGEDTILGCGESGEGAACRDPEYDHLWRECLFNEEVRTQHIWWRSSFFELTQKE